MLCYKILHIPTGNFLEKEAEYRFDRDLTFWCKFTAVIALKRMFRKNTYILTDSAGKLDSFQPYGKEEFCVVSINKSLRISTH